MKKIEWIITFFIVLIAFSIRLYRLDIPHEWSFDEVYHALSAEAYALNDPRGYEWWNPSPKDLAYEWLHPPLGKLFMAASIKIFAKPYIPQSKSAPLDGKTTFAWRFPGTVFAALTVYLLIIFGTKLFNNFWIGAVAGGLYALDGLSFVQSRTGMNDIYITFFVVLAFYRLYKFITEYTGPVAHHPKSSPLGGTPLLGSLVSRHPLRNYNNLFWLGIASGLAASTKWTGFYAVGIAGIWGVGFLLKKTISEKTYSGFLKIFLWAIFCLGLIPVAVYVLSYAQWWLQGHTIKQFGELHKQIWWYQTGLKATHDYQSQALSWPILVRPVWFYVKYQDQIINGKKELFIGNIYSMGHPFIWWAGLIGTVYALWQVLAGIWQKIQGFTSKIPLSSLTLILVGYFGMFLPWALSPRIMFMYHYLPAVPFLCLILAYGLYHLKKTGFYGNLVVSIYLFIVILGFIYFYPHWSAWLLPQKWVDKYYWLKSWK